MLDDRKPPTRLHHFSKCEVLFAGLGDWGGLFTFLAHMRDATELHGAPKMLTLLELAHMLGATKFYGVREILMFVLHLHTCLLLNRMLLWRC